MKKIFLAIAILFVSLNCIGQHKFTSRTFEVEAVDAWGDKDGSINFGIWCEGYFRNCATDEDDAVLKFYGNTKEECIAVHLYEYKNKTTKGVSSDAIRSFELINEKGENLFNARTWIERKWKRKGYINYADLISFLRNSEVVKVKLNGVADTRAYFKIDNPKECAELFQRYSGLPNQEKEKRVDDVYWYSYH